MWGGARFPLLRQLLSVEKNAHYANHNTQNLPEHKKYEWEPLIGSRGQPKSWERWEL